MGITYGLIGVAVRPAVITEVSWITCPADTEYIGTVRITNQHTSDVTVRLAHTAGVGAASGEDWDAYETEMSPGDVLDITMEMGSGETLRVQASVANGVSFKYSGQVKV